MAVPAPCLNGGVCTATGSSISCSCQDGYAGATCNIPADPCGNLTCQENASCRVTTGGQPKCFCVVGYEGEFLLGREVTLVCKLH